MSVSVYDYNYDTSPARDEIDSLLLFPGESLDENIVKFSLPDSLYTFRSEVSFIFSCQQLQIWTPALGSSVTFPLNPPSAPETRLLSPPSLAEILWRQAP